jgi:pyruvate ferredoxin oxidoreductase delta subunit
MAIEPTVKVLPSWRAIDPAGTVSAPGSSFSFKTGDWRTDRPVWTESACRHCGLCVPVCPDSSIPFGAEFKRGPFDLDHCKGCGVCAQACPFGAIAMVPEGGAR